MSAIEVGAAPASFAFGSLPPELQSLVIAFALEQAQSSASSAASGRGVGDVLVVHSSFHRAGVRHLYTRLTLTSRLSVSSVLATLETHGEYAQYVRELDVYSARVDWKQTMRLARLVAQAQTSTAGVHSLRVRFPGEAVAEALEFFAYFRPRHLEWITQSCWLLAPHHSFLRALTACDGEWSSRLVSLRLGNFSFDGATARMLATLPRLQRLTLLGSANKSLQPQTLCTLLTHGCTRDNLRRLSVADCPVRRRNLIELQLGVSVPEGRVDEAQATDDAGEASARFADSAGCVKFCPRCRIQARERIMQRYATDARTQTDEPCGHAEALELEPGAEAPPETQFLQRRVLECLRWIT